MKTNTDYKNWLVAIKTKIATTQFRMATSVNTVLISFYWELGKDISFNIKEVKWGSKIIDQLALDLKKELPNLNGFSRTNLYYIK